MTWRDISVLLWPGTPEWPGDTPFDCGWTWRIADGRSVNVSVIHLSPHVGTHADAPLHVRDGAAASHELPVDAFIGRAHVADVRGSRGVMPLSALGLPSTGPVERLLLRTGCSIADGRFPNEWPVLHADAIDALLQRGLRLVGVDSPSIDHKESKDLVNHHRLFGGSANIVENLDLRDIAPGLYDLVALPLKLGGLDAAPMRAILRAATVA
ncbi:MAG: cyclase family protein [Gemmatimonadaceae bacterium]